MIEIKRGLAIPEEELTFLTSRSGGPGGQNVNKVNSRVTLRFDVRRSPSLSAGQKQRLLAGLATRISKDGVLSVVSQKHRSQLANRNTATDRFAELLREALRPVTPRKKTRPSAASKERRLAEKKRRSQSRQRRSKPISEEDW